MEFASAKASRRLFGLFLACSALSMTACGGGGSAEAPSPPPPPPPPPAVNNQLFAVDWNSGVVAGFPSLVPAGDDAVFTGQQVGATVPGAARLVFDKARDELYVLGDRRVAVFSNATTATATVQPARTIHLPSDALFPNDIKLDTVHDRLYVAVTRQYDDQVLVYDHASAADGSVAPSRSFMPGNGARAIALDVSRSRLYATGYVIGIARYDHIDTATGQIWGDGFMANQVSGYSLELDAARDRLYLADPFYGVRIVDNISALPWGVSASIGIADITALSLDLAHDRLYVGARTVGYAFEGARSLSSSSALPGVAVRADNGVFISGFAFH